MTRKIKTATAAVLSAHRKAEMSKILAYAQVANFGRYNFCRKCRFWGALNVFVFLFCCLQSKQGQSITVMSYFALADLLQKLKPFTYGRPK